VKQKNAQLTWRRLSGAVSFALPGAKAVAAIDEVLMFKYTGLLVLAQVKNPRHWGEMLV
jgi:hypothetical protein